MEGQSRHIVVNGQYIAHMEIDTQIVGVGYVYNINQPSSLGATHDNAEDIIPDDSSSVASECHSDSLYPFVVPAKLAELNLYSMAEFEKMYREAAAKEAPDLAQFLKQYKQLGVLDFGRLNKKQIFETLQAFFPNEIHYLYNNFIYYF